MRFSKDLVGAFWASTGPAASTGFCRIPVAKVTVTIGPAPEEQRMAIPARKRPRRSPLGRSGPTDFSEEPKIAKMLRGHRALILNYFKAKKVMSSGKVEGLNNKAKVTMRKSYGFRTFRVAELALYHTLGKLPEPELTHRFY